MSDINYSESEAQLIEAMHAGLKETKKGLEETQKQLEEAESLQKAAEAQFARSLKTIQHRASILTALGAIISVALIWEASQEQGFWSLFFSALGTGLLVATTVAVAAYFVRRFWNVGTEARNISMDWRLRYITDQVIEISTKLDFSAEVTHRLDRYVREQQADQKAREELFREKIDEITHRADSLSTEYNEKATEADPANQRGD